MPVAAVCPLRMRLVLPALLALLASACGGGVEWEEASFEEEALLDSELTANPVCIQDVIASGHDGNEPKNTVDANLSTRWSASGDGVWIRYDLGASRTVLAVDVAWYQGNARVARFSIETSADGATWRRVYQGQSSGTSLGLERYVLGDVTARYVRLVGHGNNLNAWTSMTEVRFESSTPLPAKSVTASAHDGNVPTNTVDTSLTTRWSAFGDGVWIQYDLGAPAILTRTDIAWYNGDKRVSSFSLDVSNDGKAWDRIYTAKSSGTSLQPEPHTLVPVGARYLRLVGHGNTQNLWTSVTSLRIRGVLETAGAATTSALCAGSTPTTGTPTTPPPATSTPDQLSVNFDSMSAVGFGGSLTRTLLEAHFNRTLNTYGLNDLSVASDANGKYLRQRYVPTSRGSPVVGIVSAIPGGNEVFLSYRMFFESGWQWVKGGKLPGLAGGTMPTGGSYDDNGFSARFMWRQNGRMAVYAYHHDRPTKYGEDFPLMNSDGSYYIAPIGRWITITQRIKMNTSGSAWDGEVQVWIDGVQKLHKKGIRWRKNTTYSADRLLYSSFYGGNDSTWSPTKTTYARFDDFKVASTLAGVK